MKQASYQIVCLNCGAVYEEASPWSLFGCEKCRTNSFSSNLSLRLALHELKTLPWEELVSSHHGIWRYNSLLPVSPQHQITLGEGNTPLLKLDRLGAKLGIQELYLKDESRNPTWSYKDRLNSVAVSKALELRAQVITTASTGNHGISTAAYAAKAGLACVVFITESVLQTMKTSIQVYGAVVVALPSPEARWSLMRECIEAYGWYPTGNFMYPPIGSVFYGVEGYKTIAFEIFEQFNGEVPDVVIVPTAFGDGLYGIWKGFVELYQLGHGQTLPRMVAVEAFGPLANALSKGLPFPEEVPARPTAAFSIGAHISTFQALKALKDSSGTAVVIEEDHIMKVQRSLSQLEGIYGEAASVASLAALEQLLKRGVISDNDRVVCILTSTGLKDPASTAQHLGPVLTLREPDIDELICRVQEAYGVELLRQTQLATHSCGEWEDSDVGGH